MHALVLAKYQEGEDSAALELFSGAYGRELVRVKAALKMNSKLRYGCEPFSTIEAEVVAAKRGLLATSLVVTILRPTIREDRMRLLSSFAVCEAVSELAPEGLPEPELFSLLEATLDELAHQASLRCVTVVEQFFWKFFTVLGVGKAEEEDLLGYALHAEIHFSVTLPSAIFLAGISRMSFAHP